MGLLLMLITIFRWVSREQYDRASSASNESLCRCLMKVVLLMVMPLPWLEGAMLELETPTLVSYG
jgi:TRAP-type C4-dicarboxylate transport system permease large subunit